MAITDLREKSRIAAFLRQDSGRNIYALGDLDDFYWPYTEWYGLDRSDAADVSDLSAVALVYHAPGVDTIHCLQQDFPPAQELLRELAADPSLLSDRCDAHLTREMLSAFSNGWSVQSRGEHLKLSLEPKRLPTVPSADVVALSPRDRQAAEALYQESYPDNWFDPRMLETGRYFGIWDGDQLVSIAGVHVYSQDYGVAALGNITTSPAYRRRGLGSQVTAALSRVLVEEGLSVGLNVHTENRAALGCYFALGFTEAARYIEVALSRKT